MSVKLIIRKRNGRWTVDYRFLTNFSSSVPSVKAIGAAHRWCNARNERLENQRIVDDARRKHERLAMADGDGVHHITNDDRS